MVALFILVVGVGCIIPFLMEDTIKERIIGYSFVLADVLLMLVMVYSNMAGLPGYEKSQVAAIGIALIVLGMAINRGHRIINPKQLKKGSSIKTHHQQLKNQQNHKAAS